MSADTMTKDETIRLQAAEIDRLTRCIEICEENNERVGAENERLSGVIDRAAMAWLSLDPGIAFEGDVGDAMAAAVAEIKRLRDVMRQVSGEISRENEGLVQMIREALGE